MAKVLTEDEIKRDFPKVYEVFFKPKEVTVSDRKRGESLHDYLTRKNLDCWCRVCYRRKVDERNSKLL